jgi:hypothetical protein
VVLRIPLLLAVEAENVHAAGSPGEKQEKSNSTAG